MSKSNKDNKYVALTAAQEEYIRIYHTYFVLQWEHFDIQKHFKCSATKVSTAIKWVITNKGEFPSEYLIKGAIYAVRERLKQNRDLLDKELKKTKFQDKKFIIDLNNQLRTDEERLFKLQMLADPDATKDNGINAVDVLKLITAAKTT